MLNMIGRIGKMTVGIKVPNDRYLELMMEFPPRPIGCDAELELVQQRVNRVLDSSAIGDSERDYLRLLGILIYDYEERHEPEFLMTDDDRALALLE